MKKIILSLACGAAFLCGCSTGRNIVTGTTRPAIPPEQVVLYSTAPASYKGIATVMAEAGGKGQGAADRAIRRLKERAANLGANGLIVGNINVNKTERTYYGMPIGPGP